jgi:hypothetical protein
LDKTVLYPSCNFKLDSGKCSHSTLKPNFTRLIPKLLQTKTHMIIQRSVSFDLLHLCNQVNKWCWSSVSTATYDISGSLVTCDNKRETKNQNYTQMTLILYFLDWEFTFFCSFSSFISFMCPFKPIMPMPVTERH